MLLMAIGLLASASMAALAVDMGYFYLLKAQLQTTADVSALAAVRQLPDEDAAAHSRCGICRSEHAHKRAWQRSGRLGCGARKLGFR